LMIGIELVRDASKSPAAQEAKLIRQKLLEKGILIGVGGVFGNVLRFQPPLVITDDQLEEAVGALQGSLAEL